MKTTSAVSATAATSATRSHSSSTDVRRRHSKPKASTLSASGSAVTMRAVEANVVGLMTSVGSESAATIATHVSTTAAGTTTSTIILIPTLGAAPTPAADGGCC